MTTAPKTGEFLDGKLWFERKGSTVTLGLTDFAMASVGEIQSIDFPAEGQDFEKGDVIVTVDGSNGKVEVVAPATGVVTELNETAQEEPELLSEDPLEEGWLVKLEVEDTADLTEYQSA